MMTKIGERVGVVLSVVKDEAHFLVRVYVGNHEKVSRLLAAVD